MANASLGPLAALIEDAATSAVVTDFDGTLAAIVDEPDDAVALDEAQTVLARLAWSFAVVAVVSGRPVEYLQRRLGGAGPAVRLVGVYGLEWIEGGRVRTAPGAQAWIAPVAEVVAAARAEAPEHVGVEDKRVSMTLHWRRAPDAAPWARQFAARWVATTGLVAHDSRMAIDLRPPLDVDKGSALRDVVGGCQAVCYFGDDTGDLAAFAALDELDSANIATVRVAVADPESPPALIAAADMVVPGPAAALALLTKLADVAEARATT